MPCKFQVYDGPSAFGSKDGLGGSEACGKSDNDGICGFSDLGLAMYGDFGSGYDNSRYSRSNQAYQKIKERYS